MSRQQFTFSLSWSSEISICFFRSSDLSRANSESPSPSGVFSIKKVFMFPFIPSPSLMKFWLRVFRSFIMFSSSLILFSKDSSFAFPTESMSCEVFQLFSWFSILEYVVLGI